jgi:histone H2A
MPPKTTRKSKAGAKGRQAGQAGVSGQTRAGLIFAPARCQRAIKMGRYSERYGKSAGVFMAGVLEYLTAEVLDLAHVEMQAMKNGSIQPKHINLAFRRDQELGMLMQHATFTTSTVPSNIHPSHL